MNAEVLLSHLYSLDVELRLTSDLQSLDVDAPAGVVTPDLLGWIQELKPELVDLVFAEVERAAVIAESEPEAAPLVTFIGDPLLIESVRRHPMIVSLEAELGKQRGGTIEILKAA